MSWFSDIGDFISNNSNIIKPIASIGIGALNQSNNADTQSAYLDYLRQREDSNYQNYVDQVNYANASGAAGAAASGKASAAKAAAARQTEANRQAAAKKANRFLQKNYKQILAMYLPYKQTADTLLPQKTQTYENSLQLQNALLSYLNQPDQVAKLNGSIPAYNVNVPLPDYLRMK